MSCNYADGLSPYENKGILGVPEEFDNKNEIEMKVKQLVELIQTSKHTVFHTGAGISTAAGIPDFRGPNGVWTLERKGEKPDLNISFNDATPTITHMAIRCLIENNYIHYVVSQNIDGLHMKSGLDRRYIGELHGNIFVEQCSKCRHQFVRTNATESVGQKPNGGLCRRQCRGGTLLDNVLDWEHDLPEKDLDLSIMHSTLADLNVALGTTLQIVPSGNLPLKNQKFGGKLVICNLQPTKHDKKADLIIRTYVDDILIKVCKRLGLEIPEYNALEDPTKQHLIANRLEWTLQLQYIKDIEKLYNAKLKDAAAQRKAKKLQNSISDQEKDDKVSLKRKLNSKIKHQEENLDDRNYKQVKNRL